MPHNTYTELHYLAESADWRTDRYYTYALMTELLQGWVAAYPGLASLDSIGQSGEGREIWVVTLTNRAPGPDDEKPAYYIDANPTSGSEANKAPGKGKPLTAHLGLPNGARLLPTAGKAEQMLEHLAGRSVSTPHCTSSPAIRISVAVAPSGLSRPRLAHR